MKNNAFATGELDGTSEIKELFAKNRVGDIGRKYIVLTSIDVRSERYVMNVSITII